MRCLEGNQQGGLGERYQIPAEFGAYSRSRKRILVSFRRILKQPEAVAVPYNLFKFGTVDG